MAGSSLLRPLQRYILFVLLMLCYSGNTAYAGPADDIKEMPSIEKVKQVVKGKDELDTKARLVAAFRLLVNINTNLREAAKAEGNALSHDNDMYSKYSDASYGIFLRLQKELGWNSEKMKNWERQSKAYQDDPAFKDELLHKLFSPAWISHYNAMPDYAAKQIEEAKNAQPKELEPRRRGYAKFDMSSTFMITVPLFLLCLVWFGYCVTRETKRFGLAGKDTLYFRSGFEKYLLGSFTGYVVGAKESDKTEWAVYTSGRMEERSSSNHLKFHLRNGNKMTEHYVINSGLNIIDGLLLSVIYVIIDSKKVYLYFVKHDTETEHPMTNSLNYLLHSWQRTLIPLLYIYTFLYFFICLTWVEFNTEGLFTRYFIFLGILLIAFYVIIGRIQQGRWARFLKNDHPVLMAKAEAEKNNMVG